MRPTVWAMKIFFVVLVSLEAIVSSAQIEMLNSGTNSHIGKIEMVGENVYLAGNYDYFARYLPNEDTVVVSNIPGLNYFYLDLSVVDSLHLYALSAITFPHHAIVFHSSDGGYHWDWLWDTAGFYTKNILMFDTLTGVAFSSLDKGLRTTDGGYQWSFNYIPTIGISAKERYNDSVACYGISDKYCITSDKGQTWYCYPFVRANPADFDVLDDSTVFAVSRSNYGNYFSYSFNMGRDWEHILFYYGLDTNNFDIYPYGISFKNKNEGYMVGVGVIEETGKILKTTDRGQNWVSYNTGIDATLIDIAFLNDSIALICGTNGLLFKLNVNQAFSQQTSLPPTESTRFEISVYPNPASNAVNVQLPALGNEQVHLRLFDIQGREILHKISGPPNGDRSSQQLDVAHVPTGLYFLQIVGANYSVTEKLVIQR